MKWLLILTLCLFAGCQSTHTNEVEVLAFTATWCSACRQDQPQIATLQARGISVTKVDVDANPEMAVRWGVTQLPTYVILVNGQTYHTTPDIEVILYGLPTPAD